MRRMLAISAAFKALGLFKHLRIKVIIIKSQLNHKCRYSNKSCDNVFDFGHHTFLTRKTSTKTGK